MMYNNRSILKGKNVQEVYDVLCEYPEGIRAQRISQILPHIPSGRLKGILMRLQDADMICKAGRTGNNAYIWKKVR